MIVSQKKSKIIMRLYMSLQVLTLSAVAILDPRSLMAQMTRNEGVIGWVVIVSMCVLALLALTDIVVNDLLPQRYVYQIGLNIRHTIYMWIAMLYAIQLWFMVQYEAYSVIPLYLLYINFTVISAFMDVRQRFKDSNQGKCDEVHA